ncbi:MAG: peroxide stress protein YaaA [Candidatus Marinimicrobia bacterium]|nr:peroxide stress protein YaaA [Candidatus Neomarinimicrobiota bacterium]
MITILSPAKSINFEEPAPSAIFTIPTFLTDSQRLIRILKKLNKTEIMNLMSVSEGIAEVNKARYQSFKAPFDLDNAKQALFAFSGEVFRHMRLNTYDSETLAFAQNNLRILSGLYGYLRPLDLIQPYRLEMKTALSNPRGVNLFQFWGDRITIAINKDLKSDPSPVLINLASKEYAKAVNFKAIKAPVISIDFKELENGKAKIITIFAKRARGMMADFIIQNRLSNPEDIKSFDVADYQYSQEDSSESHWVFLRPRPK